MVTSGELVTSGEELQTNFHPNPSPAVEIKQKLESHISLSGYKILVSHI